ncbi:MAG TPA: DNA-binding domain-containing protein [Burkholderiaceae bacterium]|nr:DNA-binding domain-containing protein [Burkholderiaceae bacterium]
MNLHDIQAAFQRHVLSQDGAIVLAVAGTERLSARERLGIYSYAYVARLVESLGQSYPALQQVLGETQFETTARAFVGSHPSNVTSVRYYGREFSAFLEERATDATGAMLADLARWEWTLAAAFDGPDATPLPVHAAASVAPEDWAALQVRLHGSLQRVALSTDAVDWWRAATQEAARPATPRSTPTVEWVVWRQGLTTSFRSLAPDEAWAVDAALRGHPFGELCEGLVDFVGDEAAALRGATLLKSWLSEGWVTGLDRAEY